MTHDGTKLTVEIAYCARCNFLPRAAWVAQELLHTYGDFVSGLTLVPDRGGIFTVSVNGRLIFSNKDAERFPEPRELKAAINDFLEAAEVATLKKHPSKA